MSMKEINSSGTDNEITVLETKSFPINPGITENYAEKTLECGPLESVMPCSRSKVLDFLLAFRDFDYSISDIAKNSGLSFKTGLNEIRKLKETNFVFNSRNVGKAVMYKLDMDSPQVKLLSKLAMEIATRRIQEDESKEQLEQAHYSLQMKKKK